MNYFLPSELLIPRMAGIGPMTANTLGVPASWLTNVWRLKFGINVGLGCVELRLNHWSPAFQMVNQWSTLWIIYASAVVVERMWLRSLWSVMLYGRRASSITSMEKLPSWSQKIDWRASWSWSSEEYNPSAMKLSSCWLKTGFCRRLFMACCAHKLKDWVSW